MKRCWETMISEEEDQGRKRMNREEDEDEGLRLPCCSVFMRVLLVEFDDCTRQIIAALLRKCGYKVVAVHDGEKAWDVLKEKPHNFDLVMTEMTLPMLSGYDLLSLVMEHPICRKIPVIMMSSQDSISLVFKCMIKGAADFLAKPIRKNELRNLWQHVWRRNSSVEVGSGCQSENRMQENVKAVSDDQNAASNHSSHYPGGVLRGRDEQSSCTKPAMEIEGEIMDLAEEVTQPQGASTPSPSAEQELKKDEDIADMDQECTAKESEPHDSDTLLETSSNFEADVWNSKSYDPHKEAVDLLGAIDRRYRVIAEPSVHEKESNSKFVSFPLWELSLTSPHLDISMNQRMEEKHKLNHSNASAFSRYNNKAISDEHRMEVDNSRNSCHPSFVEMQGNSTQHAVISATPRKCDASKWQTSSPDSNYDFAANPAFHCHQMGLFPVPIPIKNLYGMNDGFGTLLQPIICPRTGSLWKPTSVTQSECSESKSHFQQDQDYFQDRDTNPSTCHSQSRETSVASAEEQKGCSTSCRSRSSLQEQDGRKSCTDVIGQRSSSNADDDSLTPAVVVTAVPADVPIDIRHVANAGQMASENQLSQREAALTKFRMKRKDRCFEKKVRYQSRKTLAEQRPRVKGQFVRQVYPGSTASQLVN